MLYWILYYSPVKRNDRWWWIPTGFYLFISLNVLFFNDFRTFWRRWNHINYDADIILLIIVWLRLATWIDNEPPNYAVMFHESIFKTINTRSFVDKEKKRKFGITRKKLMEHFSNNMRLWECEKLAEDLNSIDFKRVAFMSRLFYILCSCFQDFNNVDC